MGYCIDLMIPFCCWPHAGSTMTSLIPDYSAIVIVPHSTYLWWRVVMMFPSIVTQHDLPCCSLGGCFAVPRKSSNSPTYLQNVVAVRGRHVVNSLVCYHSAAVNAPWWPMIGVLPRCGEFFLTYNSTYYGSGGNAVIPNIYSPCLHGNLVSIL